MRLQHGGAYASDISTLRATIRSNGTRASVAAIQVSHPSATLTVTLYINLAYEGNSSLRAINGSLYTVAFGNAAGCWHFNVGAIGVPLPGAAIPGALGGDYGSLGYPFDLPNITDATLEQSVNVVARYNGESPVPAPVLTGLARLIVAVNEAVRFDAVESGVNGILGNCGNYAPPADVIRKWGGHTLGR